ncbi:MAG: NTP transferase domain-containing protein [Clostridia bacterium]|nr:NTP transferase domain-containing protein [Clostridia bacterium]
MAAGKGTRLHSAEHNIPKVMHTACGRPLLEIALELVDFIDKKDTYIVVGYKKEDIISYFGNEYNYIEQKEQKGTGHAVAVTADHFKGYKGNVLVTYGDMPLYRKESLKKLCETHEKTGADCTVMTAVNPGLPSYGRITRDKSGAFAGIIEAKDCTPEQLKITELNSGVAVFKSETLFKVLPLLKNNNKQSEYYLTDVPAIMMANGYKVDLLPIDDGDEIRGVNTPEELLTVEEILNKR